MPSRPFSPSCSSSQTRVFLFTAAISASVIFFVGIAYLLFCIWCSICNRSQTSPFDSSSHYKLQKFSLRELKKATNGFRDANLIGRGGSGTVFHGVLRSGLHIAVKLLEAGSIQAEREFQNELQILSSIRSPFIVSLLGFCVAKCNRFLVFEYMQNRSLQESLFSEGNSSSDLPWNLRFGIVLDVARALAFLHGECDPPVIHGDIKPSNVLLDSNYRARVSDFGLSRLKMEGDTGIDSNMFSQDLGFKSRELSDNLEVEITSTDYDFPSTMKNQSSSSSSSKHSKPHPNHPHEKNNETDPEISISAPPAMADDSSRTQHSGQDWWWRQDENGDLSTKDYIMEWIGSQILVEQSIIDSDKEKTKKSKNTVGGGKKKQRKMKAWWKEEYLAELSKKTCNSSKLRPKYTNIFKPPYFRKSRMVIEAGNHHKHSIGVGKKKKKKKNEQGANSGGGMDMCSGDIFSRELSSGTSMRGTLCYVAPEYGGCGFLVEKSDVYSFGVLILVVLSGRRPLHVLSSPLKLERANLIGWCRRLSRTGNILDVMDEKLAGGYDPDKACLCIHLALACLQRTPELRPTMEDVVKILNGEIDTPPVVLSSPLSLKIQ